MVEPLKRPKTLAEMMEEEDEAARKAKVDDPVSEDEGPAGRCTIDMTPEEIAEKNRSRPVNQNYITSIFVFVDMVLKFRRKATCSQLCKCNHDDWTKPFGAWVLIYAQLHLIVAPVYYILYVIGAVEDGDYLAIMVTTFEIFMYFMFAMFFSHLSYWYIYEHQGCCGDWGPVLWIIIFSFLGTGFVFFGDHFGAASEYLQMANLSYLSLVVPTGFIIRCLWKLGAGRFIISNTTCCFAWVQGVAAVSKNTTQKVTRRLTRRLSVALGHVEEEAIARGIELETGVRKNEPPSTVGGATKDDDSQGSTAASETQETQKFVGGLWNNMGGTKELKRSDTLDTLDRIKAQLDRDAEERRR